uniref:Ty3 transposon capsid-like protein domain-containing protein n=1 Tax=Brassica oleracea var. oleracea TaxID=109376 RepID=A0A0D3BQN0_BRAOL
MGTTKERLEALESGLGLVQDELQKLSVGMNDKFEGMDSKYQTIETSMACILELLAQNGSGESSDPTEWLSKAKQYFAYQGVPRAQKVSFASYHLTEEANEWWLATSKALGIDPNNAPWETFQEELWNRFGPTEGENFHEALSKIKQTGTLREYQRDFERLMNKVDNWSEKALVGSYLGALHASIADHIRMFSPDTLKSVINLARLRDDQLQRQSQRRSFSNHNATSATNQNGLSPACDQPSPAPKRLNWDEMKRKRSLGLCFSCDERYTPGHICRTSQLLLMEGEDVDDDDDDEETTMELEDKLTLGGRGNDGLHNDQRPKVTRKPNPRI